MNSPVCPDCGHRFAWSAALKQILGPRRQGTALWGAVCPVCSADLKVPNARVLLIAFGSIFFGSQTSTVFLVGGFSPTVFWLIKVLLILGFYAIAIFFLLQLEKVEKE